MPDAAAEFMSIGQCASLACILEVSAAKPGNVHRSADFEDACLNDFLTSAVAIAPVMESAIEHRLGETVLAARRATARVTRTNTNLGIVLLLAPLAMVPRDTPLEQGVKQILASLTSADAADVYQAIREAAPGGLDSRERQIRRDSVHDDAPSDLLFAMEQAAEWDLVARQYSNGFHDVLQRVLPWLLETQTDRPWSERIVHVHVRLMSEIPDTLIARKCGVEVAREAAARATRVLQAGPPTSEDYWKALSDLDFWMRSDGHRRNPGTSADMITAALFAGLRNGQIGPPY